MDSILDFSARPLSDRLTEILREAIVSGHLAAGTHLVEADLAARFGTSATPLRESLRRLASQGLVVIRPYAGAYVRSFSRHDVEEIYEVRECLEPLATLRALPHLDGEAIRSLDRLLALADQSIGSGHPAELSRHNRDFHSAIIERCDNRRVRDILLSLQVQVRLISRISWDRKRTQELERSQHRAIFEALKGRDGERAADLMRQHIVEFRKHAVRAFE